MTTTDDINYLLQNVEGYFGCYPCNKIPVIETKKRPLFLVVNTEENTKIGEHWVGLALYKKKCYYFDSFGVEILNKHIINYLEKLNYNKYEYSNLSIQSLESDFCGYFTISFILALENKYKFNSFLNLYEDVNIHLNDKIVEIIIKNLL